MSSLRRATTALRLTAATIVVALLCALAAVATPAAASSLLLAGAHREAEHSKQHHSSSKHHKKQKKRKKKKKKKKKKKSKPKKHKSTPKPTSNSAPPFLPALPATTTPASTIPTSTTTTTTTPPAPGVTPPVVTHLLAQQGLLVGMASNVLQTQLYLDLSAGAAVGVCNTLDGGGSQEITAMSSPSADASDLTLVLYYDSSCVEPYISSTAAVTTTATGTQISATSVYSDVDATTLGTLATQAYTVDGTSDIQLAGLGTFTGAAAGSLPVSLGLTCDVGDADSAGVVAFPCVGAVAQNFPGLGVQLGSLTPLTLSVSDDDSSLTFASTAPSTLEVGSLNSLKLGVNGANALTLSGTPLATLSDTMSGAAAGFSLFPPTPTGWTGVDATDGQTFQIAVNDDTTRSLSGNVTDGATTTYATFSLDQSGTGTITYAGAAPIPVTSWILSG